MRIGRVVVVERGGVLTLGQCAAFTDEDMTVRFGDDGKITDAEATYPKGEVHKIRDTKVEELVRQFVGIPLDTSADTPATDEQESSPLEDESGFEIESEEHEPLEEDAEDQP